ncbi:MAG TPA: D-alanyl-D-alanine carboxypeptidase [Lachnoclostridium phytofermentans]|uniref:serine-type D-Ala-D-Ala carboxypeptidase n=1 Tax=Lachnoclostridium phytofermentans TaxID=66219 RepID=A0A3D2X8R7_9FIRM|nr:D-alanyl-D-alanine carboxypeptidase [Lachnoclostridium phytofermentans]
MNSYYEKLRKNKSVQIFLVCTALVFSSFNLIKEKMIESNDLSWCHKRSASEEELKLPEAEDIPPVIDNSTNLQLNALSACLMDASNGRVLYGKDAYKEMSMASTTKIMTLLVVLENANLDDVVTVTSNAAKQPDVQLNIQTGEQYILRDLLYSLMLESHNDTAVAIAEHVGGSVEGFCNMMTDKAKEIGANHTSFKTPNGLDADGHYTTARDLSLIASYAIKNPEFCKIVGTATHQFSEVNRKRSYTVNNRNRFLFMMKGAIGIKTGFTGKAGYCFVGAVDIDGKTLVSTVLGSGWPPHKTYKWADTTKLMDYGLKNFEVYSLYERLTPDSQYIKVPEEISVHNGKINSVKLVSTDELLSEKLLLREGEEVTVKIQLLDHITAPTKEGVKVGDICYYINQNLFRKVPITTAEATEKIDLPYMIREIFKFW